MKKKKTLIALMATGILAISAMADEFGSGYYAQDCAHPGGGYNIVIYKDGTAMVEGDPDVEHFYWPDTNAMGGRFGTFFAQPLCIGE
jgi:CubicO group peptidase (beta-lactamase class C family)